MKELTVRDLRQALKGVPDDIPVRLDSDSGVDQGLGEIIVESARRVTYGSEDYFSIYANDHADITLIQKKSMFLRKNTGTLVRWLMRRMRY